MVWHSPKEEIFGLMHDVIELNNWVSLHTHRYVEDRCCYKVWKFKGAVQFSVVIVVFLTMLSQRTGVFFHDAQLERDV